MVASRQIYLFMVVANLTSRASLINSSQVPQSTQVHADYDYFIFTVAIIVTD